jgi:hypothetical protein
MEFFTVFGYWNSGLGVNKIYILHSSGSVVSKGACDCAELVCKAHMNTIINDTSSIIINRFLFEKMLLSQSSSIGKDVDLSHFNGPHTSSQAFSFAASFASLKVNWIQSRLNQTRSKNFLTN